MTIFVVFSVFYECFKSDIECAAFRLTAWKLCLILSLCSLQLNVCDSLVVGNFSRELENTFSTKNNDKILHLADDSSYALRRGYYSNSSKYNYGGPSRVLLENETTKSGDISYLAAPSVKVEKRDPVIAAHEKVRPGPFSGVYQNRITDERYSSDDVSRMLENLGYHSMNFSDGLVLGLLGDIAYYPDQVLPGLGLSSRMHMLDVDLWIEEDGAAVVRYFYDKENKPDKKMFQQALKFWADSTCVAFKKIRAPSDMKVAQGSMVVGGYFGCFGTMGNMRKERGGRAQELSIPVGACSLERITHVVGHVLGLDHQQNRPDRDQYLYFNLDNTNLRLESDIYRKTFNTIWQAGTTNWTVGYRQIPIPYDYMSVMQFPTTYMSGLDYRPVLVVKNILKQYMIDYHHPAGMLLSHYDRYVVNTAYKCRDRWKAACEKNGKSVPSCENFGYINKACKCACPEGTSGAKCQKAGNIYPLQSKARCMWEVDVELPFSLDECMPMESTSTENSFVFYEFFTVAARTGVAQHRVNLVMRPSYEELYEPTILRALSMVIELEAWGSLDCETALAVFIGSNADNKLRSLCFSTFYSSELRNHVTHSDSSQLDVYGRTHFGSLVENAALSRLVIKFNLTIYISPNGATLLNNASNLDGFDAAEDDTDYDYYEARKAIKRHVREEKFGYFGFVGLACIIISAYIVYFRKPEPEETKSCLKRRRDRRAARGKRGLFSKRNG